MLLGQSAKRFQVPGEIFSVLSEIACHFAFAVDISPDL
jgi:hypothetical protein